MDTPNKHTAQGKAERKTLAQTLKAWRSIFKASQNPNEAFKRAIKAELNNN